MKNYLYIVFSIGLLFLISCDPSPTIPPKEPETEIYENITNLFTLKDYNGFIEKTSDNEALPTDSRLNLKNTIYSSFEADAFFTFSGSVQTGGQLPPYFYMTVTKNDEKTSFWLTGDFDERIWLRYGEGYYIIRVFTITKIDTSSYGVVRSCTFRTSPILAFSVLNTNSENGKFIYPSQLVQSDSQFILDIAQDFNGTTPDELIREAYDWTVRFLQYDYDSLDSDRRKKQDTLSVYNNKCAVCEGYSNMFMSLLRARGIPVQYVSGTSYGENHGWTKVFNGREWRYADPTWGDSDDENIRYDYYWKEELAEHIPLVFDTEREAPSPVEMLSVDIF